MIVRCLIYFKITKVRGFYRAVGIITRLKAQLGLFAIDVEKPRSRRQVAVRVATGGAAGRRTRGT